MPPYKVDGKQVETDPVSARKAAPVFLNALYGYIWKRISVIRILQDKIQ